MDRTVEAEWYLDAGRPYEALRALRDADPTDPRVAYIRGRALIDMGQHSKAEDVALDGLSRDPDSVQLLELLASAQLARNPDTAERTMCKALELDPENPRLLGMHVLILAQQDRFLRAEEVLGQLMRIAPESDIAQRVRMIFLLQAARSGEAQQAAMEFLGQFPDEAYAHYATGLALLHRGRLFRGLRHLRQAAALRPQDPVLAETARVMRSFYLWPVHLTSGVIDYVLRGTFAIMWIVVFFADYGLFWAVIGGYLVFAAYKWGAVLFARAALQRRVAKALRRMYAQAP